MTSTAKDGGERAGAPAFTLYKNKYPLDAPGKEFDANARVWRIYYDEARELDNEVIKEYKESIDVLLVFVSLYTRSVPYTRCSR